MIGEELGFIGSVILILIFLFLIFHLIRLAAKIEDQFNKIFIVGFVTLLVFHILQKYWYDNSVVTNHWYSITIY